MKITIALLIAATLQVSATTYAQQVSLSKNNIMLSDVFEEIYKQTGYTVVWNSDQLDDAFRMDVKFDKSPLKEVIAYCLIGKNLAFEIRDNTIIIRAAPEPKKRSFIERLTASLSAIDVHGHVYDDQGKPLVGATVAIKGTRQSVKTVENGGFILLNVSEKAVLTVSFVGYKTSDFALNGSAYPVINLKPAVQQLEEFSVVNTGYQQLPKERATGSFTQITREMINRAAGPDILTRLEGITNGLLFNRTVATGENVEEFKLESRGRATIMSESSPLIVVDNFPFEGNIRDINPNDVESVTILKDAAAASIWGARAGNGVIVITTRQGAYNRKAEVSFSTNAAVVAKPDLFYDRNFMPSPLVMQVQKERFLRGDFIGDEAGFQAFSPYVELLIKQRDGKISDNDFLKEETRMKNSDIRNDILKYLYQNALMRQYALNVNGGSNQNRYYFSAGYDKGRDAMVGDDNQRLTLNIQNTFKPSKSFELNTRFGYSRSKNNMNAFNITDISNGNAGLQPYTRLVDEQGNPVSLDVNLRSSITEATEKIGFLPWQYIPLDDVKISDNTSASTMLNLQGSIRYQLTEGISADATYQYLETKNSSRQYFSPESYYVRNLVNNYRQADGSMPIPHNGILNMASPDENVQHSGRVQLNAQKQIEDHGMVFLAGAEIRQSIQESFPGSILYNYDEQLGVGTARMDFVKRYKLYSSWADATIPGPDESIYYRTNRYLSYFGNGSYTFKSKYILSGSARWDGSNLFGVKTNQKGTLLWSAGASWLLSSESFFKSDCVDNLRIRATYGSSGNVNKDVSTFTVINYAASAYRDPNLERYASIISPGNPSLKWEKVNTLNFGLDWSLFKGRVSGGFEFFAKKAVDLIGDAFLPPSTGINDANYQIYSYRYNYASIMTKGIDLQLTTKNLQGNVNWQTTWLFNYAKDKVLNYYNTPTSNGFTYTGYYVPLEVGRSVSGIYALPWHGLDPANGKVIVYKDGQRTSDYLEYVYSVKPGDMIYAGVTDPPYYGSILNNVEWRRFQLSVLLTWKAGYVYRRTSLFPGMEYAMNRTYHADVLNKWQKPGDELFTNVPAGGGLNGYDQNEAAAYMQSQVLISKGDHIAVQDVNFNYTFLPGKKANPFFKSVRLYTYIRNLGFLWKADRSSVDPQSPNARYPQPIQYNMGLQCTF
ncbi:SusC/RagA family TonB-linked outer membrane protein [Pedobacter sp. MC2016-14]|uniref:SusC/RagA family TonB-linked outer membrane protein n=1 Tax=Pedobacter sp. MC2016-14 TaxID=2897327 RepID=UPI001E3306AF|nr:SusC/RagA family TonB-linked outer membrane protein [Pedobacter sp. MC2016-14]MCD0488620.1 SusC/RagA family TonB-linked outer membrane protein [Pedobacter sp. MC2016-14]